MNATLKRITLFLVALMMVTAGIVSVSAQQGPADPGPRMPPGERMGEGPIRELIDAIIAATGLTEEDIRTQLSEGLTLADIITTAGGDVEAIVDAVLAPAIERAEEAVITGRITQERADEIIARLEASINEALNRELLFMGRGGEVRERLGNLVDRGLISQASEALGITVRELVGELRDGATLAEVLTAGGVDVNSFIAEAVAATEANIAQAVEEGRLTQAQADRLLEDLEATITNRVNSANPWLQGGPERPPRPWDNDDAGDDDTDEGENTAGA